MRVLIRGFFAACFLGLVMVQTAPAARLAGLFLAEVDVAGRDAQSRDKAIRLAIEEVLVRVTGSRGSLGQDAAKHLLVKPGRFVQQFRYHQLPPGPEDEEPQLKIRVQFDGVALAKAVRGAGLPFWGRERPDVLVWLAIDDRGQRFLVSENSADAAAESLQHNAALRGLPLTLPLMDLQDQRAVRFTDVWGGFTTTLEAASERYRPQVLLVGKLGHSGASGSWQGEWTLLAPGVDQAWVSHTGELEDAVGRGVGEAADRLAVQYALVTADESMRPMVVEGIRNLKDYARVHDYLAALTPVDRVQVARVTGQEVEFTLKLSADERNLLQIITLGKRLRPVEDPSFWRFRYQP